MASRADVQEFVTYLEDTLIPDLQDAGSECTAEDFERCVRIIRDQDERIERLRRQVASKRVAAFVNTFGQGA